LRPTPNTSGEEGTIEKSREQKTPPRTYQFSLVTEMRIERIESVANDDKLVKWSWGIAILVMAIAAAAVAYAIAVSGAHDRLGRNRSHSVASCQRCVS
jgi:hypothetical protein